MKRIVPVALADRLGAAPLALALVVALGVSAVTLVSGCSKLAALAKDDDGTATDAAASTAATASAATTAAATATPTGTAKTAVPATGAVAAKNAKKTLVAPSATTDRFGRNRDTDGPCPAGFVEQPGVENHSSCARSCKTDATCHGHTCVDSDVGDGKVCSEIASKTPAASASAAAKPGSKCKANEIDDGGECLKACDKDSDCPAKKTCQGIRVANPFGGTSAAQACVAP
jgi:hypothetical protein